MADGRSATRLTLAEARRRGQDSAHLDADPTYARLALRRVSPAISWFVVRYTPMSADGVTVLSIVLGVIGGLLVAVGTPASAVAALVLIQTAYLLDIADGEVARIRGTSGRRGTYLDLVGHFLQNRALYAGASLSLIAVTGGTWWAVSVGLLTLGFSMPFGYYARLHVQAGTVAVSAANPEHGSRLRVARPGGADPGRWAGWLYRRAAFIWNTPASMNLFSIALLIDALRGAGGTTDPLAVPVLIAVFGPTLAAKQVGNAIRLLRSADWRA